MDSLTNHPPAQLIRYDSACRAVAAAKAVDEVMALRDKSEALRAYAHMAKNRQMEVDAAEIRFRAERRLGELMQAQKATVGLNPGGGDRKSNHRVENGPSDPRPTLAEAGIDKHLADRARKLSAVPEHTFEGMIGEWRERVEQENERVTVNLLAAGDKHIREAEHDAQEEPKRIDKLTYLEEGIETVLKAMFVMRRAITNGRIFKEEFDFEWDSIVHWDLRMALKYLVLDIESNCALSEGRAAEIAEELDDELADADD